ncbi:MAG: hypothetical protein ABWY36_05430 [Leifsonia sp.]
MTNSRQIQHYQKASNILKMDGYANGNIGLRQRGVADNGMPIDTVVDPGEFAKELDGIVPGFHCSYRPARVGDSQPEPVDVDSHSWEMITKEAHRRQTDIIALQSARDLLIKAGYKVEAPPSYVDELHAWVKQVEGTRRTVATGEQLTFGSLADLAAQFNPTSPSARRDIELYVEIDRAVLIEEIERAGGTVGKVVGGPLWQHMWPVVARLDVDGDIVLHVTDGERVQFDRPGA